MYWKEKTVEDNCENLRKKSEDLWEILVLQQSSFTLLLFLFGVYRRWVEYDQKKTRTRPGRSEVKTSVLGVSCAVGTTGQTAAKPDEFCKPIYFIKKGYGVFARGLTLRRTDRLMAASLLRMICAARLDGEGWAVGIAGQTAAKPDEFCKPIYFIKKGYGVFARGLTLRRTDRLMAA